jgi:hypothetical protein
MVFGLMSIDTDEISGWIAGVNAQTGEVTALYATQAGALAPEVEGDFYGSGGGGGSIWQSGVGFASDRADRFFMVTGDGTGKIPMLLIWAAPC